MTIKEFAYSAQQHLQAGTGVSFKRAHIYELLAASFGFNSYAAFSVDTVLTERRPGDRRVATQSVFIKRRCIELGYQADTATLVSSTLESFLAERHIDVASISALVQWLRGESPNQDDDLGEHEYQDEYQDELFDPDDAEFAPILLGSLDAAASKGNVLAHYALALIYAPGDEDAQAPGSPYWYSQGQQGRVLAGVQKEWAEAYESHLVRAEKYVHHLKEAGRLGHQDALLALAERFDDPSFFDQPRHDVNADPAEMAAIAERMGLTSDAKYWLTLAAESGDTDAMLQLIEKHDQGDLQQCWTWVFLSQLVGTDLTRDAHYAINENGSDYDDDVGGPAFVAGRSGIHLEPLSAEQEAISRLAAQNLFEQIESEAA